MQRFVAKPITVEAHQMKGGMLPPDIALAVKRYLNDGTAEVLTGDGPRPCKHLDWIVRGPDGQFSVMRNATFEAMFEIWTPPPEAPAKRPYNRRELTHE